MAWTSMTSPRSRSCPPSSPPRRSSRRSAPPGAPDAWISWKCCARSEGRDHVGRRRRGGPVSGGLQDQRDRLTHSLVCLTLPLELLSPRRRDAVVARTAVAGGSSPFVLQPSLDQHALERGVQRPFL